MKIIQNKNYWGLKIEAIEKKKNAKYLGDFAIKDIWDNWTDSPVAVFYQENPNRDLGHTNYFGIFAKMEILPSIFQAEGEELQRKWYICNGSSAFSKPLWALKTPIGVLLSGYPHDYIEKEGYMIDGGRSGYIRYNTNMGELIQINNINGQWVEVDYENETEFNEFLINKIEKNLELMEEEY